MMKRKLCLGTVQFGLKYGVNNQLNRRPTAQEAFFLLETAINQGVTYFDTASIYGDAEEILGEFGISKYNVNVISKLKPGMANIKTEIGSQIQAEIESSLRKLKMESIDGYLLHDAKDFYQPKIMEGLQRCKARGGVKHIGVSVYEPNDALCVAQSGMVDYIQVPYNVFDQRLDQSDFFSIVKEKRIKVFARSAFLQGLLLMNAESLPRYLAGAKPCLEKFNKIIAKYNFSSAEAAFLFSYLHSGIDQVVFGVDTAEQLMDNFLILEKKNAFKPCYDELFGMFLNVDRKIITPSLWAQ